VTVSAIQTNRQVRIVATNGTDERLAVVFNDNDRQRERCRAYYEKNKPAILEYTHNYYTLNREAILSKAKAHNAK
jgi:hypothetical protein